LNLKLKDENKNLKLKNEELSKKLSTLKANIKDLKVQLDNTIYAQLDNKQKKIEDLNLQLGINKSKINSLNKALEFYEDNYEKQKALRNKYFSILNERLKNENFYLTQEDIIKELKEKNNKLRLDLNNINNQLSKEEENYTSKLTELEEKRRKYADLQKNMNSLIKDGEKSSELLNSKIQQLSEIKLNIQKIKAENEKKKRIEKNLKIKIDKVKESNKYMSGFIQENSVQDTSLSFINKQNKLNQKKILEEINTENSNNNMNGINIENNNKKEFINNESVISNVIKQTQNEINVTGPVTSNNSILLNNKENSLGINGSEQSKINEAEDYNMKEISGIMKSILED
jgi:chromosome segregation ATPase